MKKTPKNFSYRNEEGSVLYIVLILMAFVGAYVVTLQRNGKSFDQFVQNANDLTQRDIIQRTIHRYVQTKLIIAPDWESESYKHNLNDKQAFDIQVSEWGVAKTLQIKSIQVRGSREYSPKDTLYFFDRISTSGLPAIRLRDTTASLVLGGESSLSGRISSFKKKLDYATRYGIRYRGKTHQAIWQPWLKPQRTEYYKEWISNAKSIIKRSSTKRMTINQRYQDTTIVADSIYLTTGSSLHNVIVYAEKLIIDGKVDTLSAQIIVSEKFSIKATPLDEHIQGSPILVYLGSGVDSLETENEVELWDGELSIYCLSANQKEFKTQSKCKISSGVNGRGILYSEYPLSFQGTWVGLIDVPNFSIHYQNVEWGNLLLNANVSSFDSLRAWKTPFFMRGVLNEI